MAATVLSVNPQKITVSGTDEHTLNFDAFMGNKKGESYPIKRCEILFELVSGSSVQISTGAAITTDSAAITTANPRMIVHCIEGTPARFKGGAGSEVFNVSVCPIIS